jgi:hypothetical protein
MRMYFSTSGISVVLKSQVSKLVEQSTLCSYQPRYSCLLLISEAYFSFSQLSFVLEVVTCRNIPSFTLAILHKQLSSLVSYLHNHISYYQ